MLHGLQEPRVLPHARVVLGLVDHRELSGILHQDLVVVAGAGVVAGLAVRSHTIGSLGARGRKTFLLQLCVGGGKVVTWDLRLLKSGSRIEPLEPITVRVDLYKTGFGGPSVPDRIRRWPIGLLGMVRLGVHFFIGI